MSLEKAIEATSKQLAKNKFKGIGDPTLASEWGVGDISSWIPSGITALDYQLGGGLPLGRISEVFSGQESEGKSTLGVHFAIQTQRLGGVVIWVESESAIDKPRAERMGLDLSKTIIWAPECCEAGFTYIEGILQNLRADKEYADVPILIIWDTIAAAPLRTEIEGNTYGEGMAKKPRLLMAACRQLTNTFGSSPTHMMFINQSYSSMDMWGPKYISSGGKGIKYHSSIRLDLRRGKKVTEDTGDHTGIRVKITTVKNKVALPNRELSTVLYGETGFSDVATSAQLFADRKIDSAIERNGSWYKLCVGTKFEQSVRWSEIEGIVKNSPEIQELWRLEIAKIWPLPVDREWDKKLGMVVSLRRPKNVK